MLWAASEWRRRRQAIGGGLGHGGRAAGGGAQFQAQHGQGAGTERGEDFGHSDFAKMGDAQDVAALLHARQIRLDFFH